VERAASFLTRRKWERGGRNYAVSTDSGVPAGGGLPSIEPRVGCLGPPRGVAFEDRVVAWEFPGAEPEEYPSTNEPPPSIHGRKKKRQARSSVCAGRPSRSPSPSDDPPGVGRLGFRVENLTDTRTAVLSTEITNGSRFLFVKVSRRAAADLHRPAPIIRSSTLFKGSCRRRGA